MLKAVVFDMDGVIIDSEESHFICFKRFLKERGIHYTEEENQNFLGVTDFYIFRELKKKYPQELLEPIPILVEQRKNFFLQMLPKKLEPLPGVVSLIQEVKGAKLSLGLASSSVKFIIDKILRGCGIFSYFDQIVGGEDVAEGKPHPEIYLAIAKKLSVEPRYCVVLEDTEFGLRAAKAAGMKCVAIPRSLSLNQNFDRADMRVDSMEKIRLMTLKKLFGTED